MLTADAAAQHGHEYSSLRVEGTQRRSPIPRYPFISANRQRQLHGLSPLGPGKRPKPLARSQSVKVTMAELREVPEESEEAKDGASIKIRLPGTYPSETSSLEDANDDAAQVKQEEAEDSEECEEEVPSLSSPRIQISETFDSPTPKRVPRPKRQYRLAHPPPIVAPKKLQPLQRHLRPKVLLQLQQRSRSGFHKPVYEVVPASRFCTDTMLGKKLNRLRKSKDGLNSDDLVVLKVDDYKGPDDASEEAEFAESRTVLGVISVSHGQDGQAGGKVLLQLEGSTWIASPSKAGGYDFVLQEDEYQRARWYVPKQKRKRPNSVAGPPTPTPTDDEKLYFALLQPFARQHPTVASITATNLDIYDHYTPPSSLPRTPSRPSSVVFEGDFVSLPISEDNVNERILTSDILRKLIIVSGAWVFFTKGWSPFFKYSSTVTQPPKSRTPEPKPLHARSASLPLSSLVPPAYQRRMQRDSSPSSISKASTRSSNLASPAEEVTSTSIASSRTASASAASDCSPSMMETLPSPEVSVQVSAVESEEKCRTKINMPIKGTLPRIETSTTKEPPSVTVTPVAEIASDTTELPPACSTPEVKQPPPASADVEVKKQPVTTKVAEAKKQPGATTVAAIIETPKGKPAPEIIEKPKASETPADVSSRPRATSQLSADSSYSGLEPPLHPPTYWQEYDLFHARSLQRRLTTFDSPSHSTPRTASTGSNVPPKPEDPVAVAEEEIVEEQKPLRRASTLRSRVMPYFSKIKFGAQKKGDSQAVVPLAKVGVTWT